jgi:hypothetical protein
MKFAKVVYWIAGIWGVLILTPLYFMFDAISRNDPPAITHPGFYYGFVGVGLAWQVVFIVIARDPVRFRTMMIPAMLEKFGYGASFWCLVGSMCCLAHFFCLPSFELPVRHSSSVFSAMCCPRTFLPLSAE